MKIEEEASHELPTSLLLVIIVILTVLVAMFLASSDELQTRLPSPIRPTTIVQSGFVATPAPQQLTDTPSPSDTPSEPTIPPTATSISIIAEASCNNAPSDWIPVVVGPQDTLYILSIRYGATIGEIIQANCLEGGTLFSGMIIYLPSSPPTRTPCGPPQWWETYIVRPGDTLSSLARRHRTTVYAIMQANCLSDTRIFAGRSLYLPPLPATVPPPPTVVFPSSTPFPTPTTTSTGIPSPTPSATADGTVIPTATPTPPTGTGTAVPTITPTITGTPPATNTPTPTTTSPPEGSPTATTSPTTGPTETAVPTSTPTLPPTNTPIPTEPPTSTPQPTATNPPPPSETPEP